jgi:translation elongation factor P/translation initiation factor 5A
MAGFDYNRGNTATSTQINPSKGYSEKAAIVYSVITELDEIPNVEKSINNIYGYDDVDYLKKDMNLYGAIRYKFPSMVEVNEKNLPIAYPLDKHNLTLPVKDEMVHIQKISGIAYYHKVKYNNSPNFDTNPNLLLNTLKQSNENDSSENSSDELKEIANTGISNSDQPTGKSKTIKPGFQGDYFKRDIRVHQLSLKEGDTLIQGRFGNSLRFSGYMHDSKTDGLFYPSIFLRNGESVDNMSKKIYDIVDEDINEDGTSIHITSGKYITKYKPVVNYSKSSHKFPSEAKGDQIVINSDRVTISSKAEDLYLFSKKKLSIFANDVVSIDTDAIDFTTHNGDMYFTSKNRNDIIFEVENGKIMLGGGSVNQQMLLGNKLTNLIAQLIDAINQMQIATPSGPSAPGPINRQAFTEIGNQLKDCLSKTNYLV